MAKSSSLLGFLVISWLAGWASPAIAHRPSTYRLPPLAPIGADAPLPRTAAEEPRLRSMLPGHGDGSVVHQVGGLRVRWRPHGMFAVHADGTRTLVARPLPAPSVTEPGGMGYHNVYPGVSERHLQGRDFVKREITFGGEGLDLDLARVDTLLVSWSVELENVGLMMRLPEHGGGLMVFDEQERPVLWMIAPFVADGRGPGDMPEFSVRYQLGVAEGQMEIGVEIAVDQLQRGGVGFPLLVDVTAVDLR